MLKPWPNMIVLPGLRFGRIESAKMWRWTGSGARIMMTSAHAEASSTDATSTPSFFALASEREPARRPTFTWTPESRRFCACA